MKVRATILVADLVGWTRLARKLEQNLDVDAVTRLNAQVRAMVEESLAAGPCGLGPPREFDGDGVTIFFDHPSAAHDFGIALNHAAEVHNRGRSDPDAKRYFRVGIATGELDRIDGDPPNFEGAIRSDAVRLCAAADPGHIVADLPTLGALPPAARNLYLGEEVVVGKRVDETFRVRRCLAGSASPAVVKSAAPERRTKWVTAAIPLLLVMGVTGFVLPWAGCARTPDARVGGDANGSIVGDGNSGITMIGPGARVEINPPAEKKPEDEYTAYRDGAGPTLMKVANSRAWIGAILGGETENAFGRLVNGNRVRLLDGSPPAPDDQPWGKVLVLDGPLKGTTGWLVRSDLRR